jgi:hypothetical protein
MRKIIIFALFLSACGNIDIQPCKDLALSYSDAQPIQLWPINCDTFNQKEIDGVFSKCFCQPFQCDDEIAVQFTVPIGGTIETIISVTLPALSTWLTRSIDSNLVDWNVGTSTPNVTLPATSLFPPILTTSEILYVDYNFLDGYDYVITINYTRVINSGSSNPRTTHLIIMDNSFNELFSQVSSASVGANSTTISFTATTTTKKIGFWHSSGSNVTITVNSTSATRNDFVFPPAEPYFLSIRNEDDDELGRVNFQSSQLLPDKYRYDASFVPTDLGICDEKIQVFIVHDSTPDSDILKSDCIHVKTSWDETVLINYYNQRNFAGLIDPAGSPSVDFNLRIPAIFFQERFPQEQEVEELSNSREIQLFSQIKSERLLETGPMPFYFHKKTILALQHQFVTIDNQTWVKANAYEMQESNKRWPLRRGLCWLTEKDFVVRNVL